MSALEGKERDCTENRGRKERKRAIFFGRRTGKKDGIEKENDTNGGKQKREEDERRREKENQTVQS